MHLLGIDMGANLLPATRHNPKGHYENIDYFKMNQEILRSANSTWNRPPSREKIKTATIPGGRMRAFLAKHEKSVWGLKDPRTLLTFEIWKPYFEEVADITYVFVHRPFEASVRSLAHRDRISIANASQILKPYLINLYYYRHTYKLPPENIIDVYYQDIIDDPEPFVKKFNEKIGNPGDHHLDKIKEFLDIKLKKF
jgi:hypothetical protein